MHWRLPRTSGIAIVNGHGPDTPYSALHCAGLLRAHPGALDPHTPNFNKIPVRGDPLVTGHCPHIYVIVREPGPPVKGPFRTNTLRNSTLLFPLFLHALLSLLSLGFLDATSLLCDCHASLLLLPPLVQKVPRVGEFLQRKRKRLE